jgi:amino acid transporter
MKSKKAADPLNLPPSLKRSMKMLGALFITLSVITPASSVFVVAPSVVQQAGTGAFLSFVAGAIACLFTAFVYAELASAFPFTGGEYTIVGRILGPLSGFIILGLNLVTLILVITVLALGVSTYLAVLLPGLPVVSTAIATIVLASLFAILNIRTNAVVTGIFLVLEMLALAVLAVLGFGHISRPLGDFLFNPVHLNSANALEPASFGLIGLATSVAIFAYNGYGTAVYLGEETHDAPKHIARAIMWSLFIGVIAEAVPVTAVLLGAPDLKTLFASQNLFSDFIAARGGMTLNNVVSLGIALAIINADIASMCIVARMLFSTGRDHVWPRAVNHALTRIHKTWHSPWIATLVCGVLASAACFIDLNLLLVITGTTIVAIYMSLCIAAIAGRENGKTGHAHYRMPWHPLPAIAALLIMGYVIYASYLDPAVGRPSLFVTLGIIVISAGYYLLVLRRRGNWTLRGPED